MTGLRVPGRIAATMLHEGEVVRVLLVERADGVRLAEPSKRRRGLSVCTVIEHSTYPGQISTVTGRRYPQRHLFKLRASDDGRIYTMRLGGGSTIALAEV